MRSLDYFFLFVTIVAFVAACGAKPASISLQPEKVTLIIRGQTHTLKVEAKDAAGKTIEVNEPIVWSSENDAVSTVDALGMVKAASSGTTNIKATLGNLTASVPVTVRIITSIVITPKEVEVAEGTKVTLTTIVKDDEGNLVTGEKVLWRSADQMIALVGADSGIVTGVRTGKTTITAQVFSFSDTTNVTVKTTLDKNEENIFMNSKAGRLCKKHSDWSRNDCERLANGKIWIGMSYEMVVASYGRKPDSINPSNYGHGVSYQYCWFGWNPSCFYDENNDGIIEAYN